MKETEPKYSDSLVKISNDGILFKCYGILGGDRFVPFGDIEKIVMKKPTIWGGRWRWHGTGDFKTWFPQDYARQNRDIIFVAYLPGKWWRIGFTVEDSPQVASIFQEKGLLDNIFGMSMAATSKPDDHAATELREKNKRTKTIFWIVTILSGVVLPLVLILYYVFFD